MPLAQLIVARKRFSEDDAVAGCTQDSPKPFVTPRTVCATPHGRRWGVIMAGGDGTRLRELTKLICGDDRPKQFCRLTGADTLFEQTCKRVRRLIPAQHLLASLTKSHSSYYFAEQGIPPAQRIVQPCNKGTGPPIAHSLLSIERQDAQAVVAVLPCDHHYEDEAEFAAILDAGFEIADSQRESVVLLGANPQGPEVEYGWIELGSFLPGHMSQVFGVKGFREKPSLAMAQRLFASGCLWNTFVMVGRVRAFLELMSASVPDLVGQFREISLWSGSETKLPESLYERLMPVDFSSKVLSTQPSKLVALRMERTGWSDLGRAERVMALLVANGLEPWWMRSRPSFRDEVTCGV